MNSSDNFKEILNRKFRDFEELPPENDWELFKNKFDLKRSRNLLYRRLSYISAIVVVSIITTMIILQRNNDQKNIPEQNLPNKDQQEKILQSKPGKNNQPSSDSAFLNNSTKKIPVSKHQTSKIKETPKTNSQTLQSNKAGKHYADTTVKISAIVIREKRPVKTPLDIQTDKQNMNFNKKDKPFIKAISEDSLHEKTNNNIEPVVNNIERTDSLSWNNSKNKLENSKSASLNTNGENSKLEVVNVITPNGDGINDKLVVKNIEQFAPCKLNIYNSWGEKIYSSSNYQNIWDGTYKGKIVSEGTYYYVLETKDGKVYKGAVNILK